MAEQTGRITVSLPADLVARLRERQAEAYGMTGLHVGLGEIARQLIELGLAAQTRNTMSSVSSPD